MAIVETKIETRASTSQPFFNDIFRTEGATIPEVIQNAITITEPYLTNNLVRNQIRFSEDGLIRTHIRTYTSLEVYSELDTICGIAFDAAYKQYYSSENFVLPPEGMQQYVQSGIDAPFTCTTTYTYDPDTISTTYPLFDSFVNIIEVTDKLTEFTNTGTQLIAVHTYDNSADFTETHWKDYFFVEKLFAANVTRTITYAML